MICGRESEPRAERCLVQDAQGPGLRKYDNASHGSPHAMNSELFWQTKRQFAEKYGAQFTNFGGPAPAIPRALTAEFEANLKAVADVMARDQALVDYLAETGSSTLGDSVPDEIPRFPIWASAGTLPGRTRCIDFRNYPADLSPSRALGSQPRRARQVGRVGQRLWRQGIWPPAFHRRLGRPRRFNQPHGFAQGLRRFQGLWLVRAIGTNRGGPLAPGDHGIRQRGMMAGMVTVNLARGPREGVRRFLGRLLYVRVVLYLKYGMFRLLSQLAQDCELKVGKVIWVAGHSGPGNRRRQPDPLRDLRAGCDAALPRGHIINLHPWEYNEVPVLLAAALQQTCRSSPCISPGRPSRSLTARSWVCPRTSRRRVAPTSCATIGRPAARRHRDVQGTSAIANIVKSCRNSTTGI